MVNIILGIDHIFKIQSAKADKISLENKCIHLFFNALRLCCQEQK
jgi:hypothetical protein